MLKVAAVQNRYDLKSLYEEIDLFDRKLAHAAKFEKYPTESEREAAVSKMTLKRAKLERSARKLMEDGIEFEASDVPRSLRPDEEGAGALEA
jgi:hypothetical protein